jgi:hypothetical protein
MKSGALSVLVGALIDNASVVIKNTEVIIIMAVKAALFQFISLTIFLTP